MKRFVLIWAILGLALVQLISSCGENSEAGTRKIKVAWNVPALVNKTTEQIQEYLGEPDSTYQDYGARGKASVYLYDKHKTAMYFYSDSLKEIFMHDPRPIPFDVTFTQHLGIFPTVSPDYYIDSVVVSWGNLPEYNEVKLFTQTVDDEGNFEYKIWVNAK